MGNLKKQTKRPDPARTAVNRFDKATSVLGVSMMIIAMNISILLTLAWIFMTVDASLLCGLLCPCQGPLLWTISGSKNSLVIHDLTKQRGALILNLPAMVFCIRLCPPDGELPDRLVFGSWITTRWGSTGSGRRRT